MIVTLTPHPSIDRTIALDGPLRRGGVQEATSAGDQHGGKGVNISRACLAADLSTVAVLPALEQDPFVVGLRHSGVECCPVPPAGPIRTNITITEPDGTTTKVNTPGARVTSEHTEAMARAVIDLAPRSAWTVLAGSLPPGAEPTFYADVTQRLRPTRTKVAVDTSGAALAALADALPVAAPDLMKPNGEELASLTGVDPLALEADPVAVAAAAQDLVRRGAGAVLASLGAHGAVLATAEGSWHAGPPPTTVVSTVGAGDSSLFGYLLADLQGLDAPGRLAMAVAYGSAAAGLPGTTVPTPDQVNPDLVAVTVLGG